MRIAAVITGQLRDYKVNALNHINHLIDVNNMDVFVYACNKNTMHTIGDNIKQEYKTTTAIPSEQLAEEIKAVYGDRIKELYIDENENLAAGDFGTLGYFKRKMNNQMGNIRKGFLMAKEYANQQGFEYDIIVRLRPDNSHFPAPVDLSHFEMQDDRIYSTVYPSGHRDPWFFSFCNQKTFDTYCSFVYLDGEDESRTDNNFPCPELALEDHLRSNSFETILIPSICLPFYGYDKSQPITEFPYRNKEEKLINHDGLLVTPVVRKET